MIRAHVKMVLCLSTPFAALIPIACSSTQPSHYFDPRPTPAPLDSSERITNPIATPSPSATCASATNCAPAPTCAECPKCVQYADGKFCNYMLTDGSQYGLTCRCFQGQVEFCYIQVGGLWRLGTKSCSTSDGKKYDWNPCVPVS